MATSSTGDLSESFLHLSLDFTDRLSSADDWTTRSLDDLLSYLKLAKLHDHDAAPERPQTKETETNGLKFSSQSTPLVPNARLRRYSFDLGAVPDRTEPQTTTSMDEENPSPSMDAAALFKVLQPLLDQYITQNHTSSHGPWTPDNLGDRINAAGQKLGECKTQTNLTGAGSPQPQKQMQKQPQTQQKHPQLTHTQPHQKRTQDAPDILQPQKDHMRLPYRANDLDQFDHLDMELRIDDTFDHARRINSDGTIRYGSPGTTPPGSSRDSHFTDSRCTMIEKDDIHSPDKTTQNHTAGEKLNSVAPQVDLPNLTVDQIDFPLPEAPEETVAQLKLQLEQYKQDNAELVNEVRFLRGGDKGNRREAPKETREDEMFKDRNTFSTGSAVSTGSAASRGSTDSQGKDTTVKETAAEHHVPTEQLTEDNVPEEFRPYYRRLQLDKIDELSDTQKSNIIKNVMLSLLVTDFDHLPSMAPKVGAYLRLSARFLDELHGRLYVNSEMRPLLYLRDYGMDPGNGLEECLAGMLSKIG